MKEFVKISNKIENFTAKELLAGGLAHFFVALAGFIASKAIVLDKLLPFGLSIIAGSPIIYTPSVALGVFIGYFIPAVGNGAFRYIAALFAVLAIKLLLSGYKKIVNNPYFSTLISLLAIVLTSAVALKGMELNLLDVLLEAFLCAIATYLTARSFNAIFKAEIGLTNNELSEFLIIISILLMGTVGINIYGISLGRISGVLLILISSKYGGVLSGAVSGISVALTFSLSGISGNIGICYAFAGLMTGIFTSLGKYAQVSVFMIFGFIGACTTKDISLIARTVTESALSSTIFLLLPRNANIVLGKVFSSQPKISIPTGIKKSLTMRLDLASNALKDVSDTVEQVSRELSKINAPNFSAVITSVEQDACTGCKLRIHCWEKKRKETVDAILEMTKAVKQGEYSPESTAPDEFKGRCSNPERVGSALYKRYSDYAAHIAAENRIDEVRSVISDQFNGISSMLRDLSLDFKNDELFDNSSAQKMVGAFKNLNIHIKEACCRIDKYGRMTAEFKLKKTPELIINKLHIMKAAEIACERNFDVPTISEIGGNVYIVLNEHADITIDIGVEQSCASNSGMCGDAYKYFYDGKGHFIAVLSDGMGTGGRAAVDGAMASGLMTRLIKAGFGYDCSLSILNSSMLFKSTDESLATVDIASIDLYTGLAELYKAGAAPTILRRSGKTGKAESSSLPAGILREIGFDKASIKCKIGDIIVLMSDGATSSGTDWLRAEIEAWEDGSAQKLAEKLCAGAKRRTNNEHIDDITVMVAILNKAN